jgi:hypothetical protein
MIPPGAEFAIILHNPELVHSVTQGAATQPSVSTTDPFGRSSGLVRCLLELAARIVPSKFHDIERRGHLRPANEVKVSLRSVSTAGRIPELPMKSGRCGRVFSRSTSDDSEALVSARKVPTAAIRSNAALWEADVNEAAFKDREYFAYGSMGDHALPTKE